MKQENIKKIMEQIRSKKNNETNELVATAEEVSLLNATNEVSMASYTPDFSNEYVAMTGLGINGGGDMILTYGPLIGTGYGYTLVTQVEVNIAALCSDRGISKNSLTELYLKLSGSESSITYCEVDDENINYKGTVQKVGNVYQIPLSLLKTGSTFPDVVTFHVWAPEAGTSEELTYLDIMPETSIVLSQINVTTAPTKTKYIKGETFDPAGMVVTATYSDGSTKAVTGYMYSPNGVLTPSNNSITISYTEGGVTKTTTQAIKVREYPSDFSNEYVDMVGFAFIELGSEIPSYDMLIGTAYGAYTLVTRVEVDIVAICASRGYSKYSLPELYLKLSGNESSIISCEVDDVNINYKGTVYKGENFYYIPLHWFKEDDGSFPNTVTFYLSAPEADTSDTLAYADITTSRPVVLSKIDVTMPTKTVYLVGETVDRTEIEVTATYTDGTTQEVEDYIVSPAGGLTLDSTEITISYGNYTVKQTISVHLDMDKLKCKSVNTFGDFPQVDLLAGNLFYESSDISIGANRNKITISHAYNSDAILFYNELNTRLGKGWKLNVQQYIVTIRGAMHYIDAQGYMHEFKNSVIEGGSSVYQDIEGENLTLYYPYMFYNKKCYLLKDSGDNYLLFDEKGRMIRMISAPCSKENILTARAVIIQYDSEGKLEKVYDSFLPENYLSFLYSKEKLVEINVDAPNALNKYVVYNYDADGNLNWRIIKNQVESYIYNGAGSLLQRIISHETGSSASLTYDEAGRVVNSALGYINDSNNFVSKSSNTFNYKKDSEGFVSETTVTNEKGVSMVYMFNRLGELVSSFEKLDNNHLETLKNETGRKITSLGSSTTEMNINGCSVARCSTGVYSHNGEIALCREGEEEMKNFAINCYVKLEDLSQSNLRAVIKYTFNSQSYVSSVRIDKNIVGVWKRVFIPLSLPQNSSDNVKINAFTFGIYDENGNAVPFSYSNIYATPCPNSSTILVNGDARLPLNDVLQVEIVKSNNTTKTITVGSTISVSGKNVVVSQTPITYYDLLETAKSLYRYQASGGELFLDGGKTRYAAIKNVKLIGSTGEKFELINLSTGKCNFVLEQCSTDNATVTKIEATLQAEDVLTTTTITCGEKSSSCSVLTTYDGRTLYEKDAYNVITRYYYDDHYNVIKVTRESLDSSGKTVEMILSQAAYDEKGDYVLNSSSGFSSTAFQYDTPYETLMKGTERSFDLTTKTYTDTSLNKSITYDGNNRISTVSLKNGNTDIFSNTITYEKGKIRTVTDGTVKYGVQYDIANDKVRYTVFDGNTETTIHQRSQEYTSDGKMKYIDTYYRNPETDTVTATFDKYGKILSLSDGTNTVDYTYTNEFNGYAGADLIKTVTDPYENKTYTYHYDHDGKMCGWNAGNSLSVQQISQADTKYVFGTNEKYKIQTVYDENVVNQPRVFGLNFYSDTNTDKDVWGKEIDILTCKYRYDYLGRMREKEIGGNVYTYSYLQANDGSLLPNIETITHAWGGYTTWTYKYSYDNRGNVLGVMLQEQLYGSEVTEDGIGYIAYTYDEANRLLTEKIAIDWTNKDRSYQYVEEGYGKGKLELIINDANHKVIRSYTYNSRGQIDNYIQDSTTYSYMYDNYGNVKEKKKGTASEYQCGWTRGNLLQQITLNGKTVTYGYNHKNVRFRKEVTGGLTTTYYLDGSKILGEDRSDGTKLRYFYDHDGLIAFSVNGERYQYFKDGQNNIVGIADAYNTLVAKYTYDSLGTTYVLNPKGLSNNDPTFIGNINPFRWKSHYFDVETGFYNVNGRYYEVERGGYIDALEADCIESNAYELFGLDRNGVMCLTLLMLAPYSATVETMLSLYVDPTYDPEAGYTWWDKYGLQTILYTANILSGIVMMFTCNVLGGILTLASGVLGIVGMVLSEQLAGAGSMALMGIEMIIIGVQSLNCCTPYGILAMAVGASCVAFATSEAQESLGYGNWMKDAGMSDGWYTGLMTATNFAATAINIIGPKCFIAGTLVLCMDEDGNQCHKPIEDVKVGDMVWAYDEETGENDWKPVVRLFRNQTKEWYHVFVNGEEIVCTGGHPFYVVGEGFVEAKNLKISDKLLLSSGKCVTIEEIQVEQLSESETTYNFEVADFHTYYVTEANVLVHNFCEKEHADYSVDYYAEGQLFRAYHQSGGPQKGNFVAKDAFGHGHTRPTKYKVLKKVAGSKLELIGDLNEATGEISKKHSSNVGQRYVYRNRRAYVKKR